ncbi:sulfatase-like hydrolase/transferase [Candidatus Latescibacterota bacterium]
MNRREFIKRAELLGAGALAGTKKAQAYGRTSGSGTKSGNIKNILFLFVDQQRQDCLACYGNPIVQTPNLDRLAQNGILFNNAFTPTALCSPARTSLQTGLWPHNTHIMFNTAHGGRSGGAKDPDPSIPFFSDSLKENRWQLAHVGKWHIGTEKNKPSDHGYDGVYYPGYGLPSHIYGPRHDHYMDYLKTLGLDGYNLLSEVKDPKGRRLYSGMQEGPQEASIPTYLANQTIDYIKDYTGKDSPFFISCNFWGPHEPYCIPEKHYTMYKNENIQVWPNFNCDLSDKPDVLKRYGEYWQTEWFTERILAGLIAEYYGYITLIDEEIGRIVKALEDSGKLDETLIVYTADHGSTVGSYNMWAKGFGLYDVVSRIPMIVSHPSIKPSVSDAFVTLLDLAPTFLEAAGCSPLEKQDGASLSPMMEGRKSSIREDHIVTEAFGHVVPFWQRMVRTQHTKYIFSPSGVDEFYDLETDPWETKNIFDTVDKKTLKEHRDILLAWIKETGDPLRVWATPML